jgi:phosphate transport system permease protein
MSGAQMTNGLSTRAATKLRERPGSKPNDPPTVVDQVFTGFTRTSGIIVLGLLVLIAVFLFREALPAFREAGWSFFTEYRFDIGANNRKPELGVLGLLLGTMVVAVIATGIAIPVSVLTALFITDIARGRARQLMIGLVDLLAAIPSLLYGLWGFAFLSNYIPSVSEWTSGKLGFLAVFGVKDGGQYIQSYFIAGTVVSMMTLPIITSICREVFDQAPPGEKEAALALGSTRWGMLWNVVLPFGRGGIIGGSMLGLGRALGETIAVSLLLPQIPSLSVHVFEYGGATISGFIANNTGAQGLTLAGLLGAGLVLFCFTLITNFLASIIISRSRSGAGVDA